MLNLIIVSELELVETVWCQVARKDDRIPVPLDLSEAFSIIKIGIEADGINCKINAVLAEGVRSNGSLKSILKQNPYAEYVTMRDRMVQSAPHLHIEPEECFAEVVKQLLRLMTSR